jgi:hypothetical protein
MASEKRTGFLCSYIAARLFLCYMCVYYARYRYYLPWLRSGHLQLVCPSSMGTGGTSTTGKTRSKRPDLRYCR